MHHLAEAQLVGRIFLRRNQRLWNWCNRPRSEGSPASTRDTSSASIPAAWISNCLPFVHQRVPDFDGSFHGIQISVALKSPGAPCIRVREISTARRGNRATVVLRNISGCDIGFRRPSSEGLSAESRACSAKAAVCSEIVFDLNVIRVVSAFCRNQRRLGSAAVQRYLFSSRRVNRAIVDDLAVFIAPAGVDDLPHGDFVTSRVITRLTSLSRPCRVIQITCRAAIISIRAQAFADPRCIVLVVHFVDS